MAPVTLWTQPQQSLRASLLSGTALFHPYKNPEEIDTVIIGILQMIKLRIAQGHKTELGFDLHLDSKLLTITPHNQFEEIR